MMRSIWLAAWLNMTATVAMAQAPRPLAHELGGGEAKMTVSSPAFKQGERIPDPYGADGDNFSPALTWTNLPSHARSVVVMVEDPDAATPNPFVHWTLYNLPAGTSRLDESIPAIPQLPQLSKAKQGRNSRGTIGYTGPRPPKGDPPHHYHFQVFALDVELAVLPSAEAQAIIDAMKGHVLAWGELVGLFSR
jgi:Raf kinase inhibitor-like YbhB/YbcL family protein